jgi:hypothetical protein
LNGWPYALWPLGLCTIDGGREPWLLDFVKPFSLARNWLFFRYFIV